MQDKLILHIGMGKTGTSSLQYFLSENISNIEKQGYSYIHPFSYKSKDRYQRGHSALVHSLYKNKDTFSDQFMEKLLVLKKKFIPIVSAEDFFCFPERAFIFGEEKKFSFDDKDEFVRKVWQYFSVGFNDIKIVVYLRRQDEVVQAWANQMSKRTLKFVATPEFIIEKMGLHFDYDKTLSIWEKYFDRKNITVRVYEKSSIDDTVVDFCKILNIDTLNFSLNINKASSNLRISRSGVDYMNFMRSYNFPDSLWDIISDAVWDISTENILGYEKEHDLLSFNEKNFILKKYAEGNKAVSMRYFNKDSLFIDQPANNESSPRLDLEGAMRITASILHRLYQEQSANYKIKPLSRFITFFKKIIN